MDQVTIILAASAIANTLARQSWLIRSRVAKTTGSSCIWPRCVIIAIRLIYLYRYLHLIPDETIFEDEVSVRYEIEDHTGQHSANCGDLEREGNSRGKHMLL